MARSSTSLVANVYKENGGAEGGRLLLNLDSQAPNRAAEQWLKSGDFADGITDIKREVTYQKSRFDLAFLENKKAAFMEVKGVTLEFDGTAYFPDAPTERGVKHILELKDAAAAGYEAYILFVIQMKGIHLFTPNKTTHLAFGEALLQAFHAGVHVLAYDCLVTENSMKIDMPVPIELMTVRHSALSRNISS